MSRNLYIAAAEKEAGKSMVVLGVMEFLSRHIKHVGFFRPIVGSGTKVDNHIDLIQKRYNLNCNYEEMYGITVSEMIEFINDNNVDAIHQKVIQKYKILEKKCDFVLVEGSDFRDHLSAYEFNFNLQVANNLGCPIIGVLSGRNKSTSEVAYSLQIMQNVMDNEKCTRVGMVVNRANINDLTEIKKILNDHKGEDEIDFVIPEVNSLQNITMRQIKFALNAKHLYGSPESLDFDVTDFKVGAMNLEHFLEHTKQGTMVITPADRIDIIMGIGMTILAGDFPKIAGILLTGTYKPNKIVSRLLDSLKKLPLAVLSTETGTYEAAKNVSNITPLLKPENQRRIATALGHFEANVNLTELGNKISISKTSIRTPLMFEYELFERAKANKKHIVLPEGTDDRILKAADILNRRNVVELTLLGDEQEIIKKASALRIKLEGINIIDPYDNDLINEYAAEYYRLRSHKGVTKEGAKDLMHDVSYLGTMMVHKGHADGMVSGAVHTTLHTIRPAFEFIKTKPGVSIVSSSFFMCLEDKVLVYGDCAVNPNPNAEELADIAISSADTAIMFGIEPRIAMLSYSTGSSGKGTDVDKVRAAAEIVKKRRPDLKTEGPIQYDAAIDASVAKTKLPDSEVAGKATIFIFPDLNTGNNTYKAVQRSANAIAIGPVLQGLNKPVNDLSRGCLVADIVNTVVITAIQAQQED
ncbi:MAG: phosphate acetyltransferase [Marinilabiliales bacterium]|nr:MAG: phosphate acetyltransferase [Marinilabiliales bacterium]